MFRLQTRLHPRPARVARMRCAEAMAPMYAMNVPLFPPTPSKSNMFAVQTIYQSCLVHTHFPVWMCTSLDSQFILCYSHSIKADQNLNTSQLAMIVPLGLNAKTIVNYYMSYVLVLSLELTFKSSNKSDMRFMLQLLMKKGEWKRECAYFVEQLQSFNLSIRAKIKSKVAATINEVDNTQLTIIDN